MKLLQQNSDRKRKRKVAKQTDSDFDMVQIWDCFHDWMAVFQVRIQPAGQHAQFTVKQVGEQAEVLQKHHSANRFPVIYVYYCVNLAKNQLTA